MGWVIFLKHPALFFFPVLLAVPFSFGRSAFSSKLSEMGIDVTRKIELRCIGSEKQYFNEFWINLPSEIDESETLAKLVHGAKDKEKFRGNCAEKIYIEIPGPK